MNSIAQELNSVLESTIASDLLSDFGKRFYFPKGIVAQSAEAKKKRTDLMRLWGWQPVMVSPCTWRV